MDIDRAVCFRLLQDVGGRGADSDVDSVIAFAQFVERSCEDQVSGLVKSADAREQAASVRALDENRERLAASERAEAAESASRGLAEIVKAITARALDAEASAKNLGDLCETLEARAVKAEALLEVSENTLGATRREFHYATKALEAANEEAKQAEKRAADAHDRALSHAERKGAARDLIDEIRAAHRSAPPDGCKLAVLGALRIIEEALGGVTS